MKAPLYIEIGVSAAMPKISCKDPYKESIFCCRTHTADTLEPPKLANFCFLVFILQMILRKMLSVRKEKDKRQTKSISIYSHLDQ